MKWYIVTTNDELCHAGVKGMKWGRRKARPLAGPRGRRGAQPASTQKDVEAQRRAKIKKRVAIGATVAGVALAAYGAHWVKSKHVKIEAQRGRDIAKKAYEEQVAAAAKRFNTEKGIKGIDITSNASSAARSAANTARKDSFGTAAKNVINYKRSGGNLKSLQSVNYLSNIPDEYAKFRR